MIPSVGLWVIPLAAVVFLLACLVSRLLRQADTKMAQVLAKELATPALYTYDKEGILQRGQDAYFDVLETFEKWFCEQHKISPTDPLPPDWLSKLPEEKRKLLTTSLLEWSVCWVFFCRAVEKERNRISPLNRHGLINSGYYESVRGHDDHMHTIYKQIRAEAEALYPGQDPSSIIRESVDILDNKGYKPGTGLIAWAHRNAAEQQQKAEASKPRGPGVERQMVKQMKLPLYEMKQTAEEMELTIWVPPFTQAKDVAVKCTSTTLLVGVRGETVFGEHLLPGLEFDRLPDLTWQLQRNPDFEPEDEVVLQNLTKTELNGQTGCVCASNRESLAKGRIRVRLAGAPKKRGAKDDALSIKPENLKNQNVKKVSVLLVLNKKKKPNGPPGMWVLPPFGDL